MVYTRERPDNITWKYVKKKSSNNNNKNNNNNNNNNDMVGCLAVSVVIILIESDIYLCNLAAQRDYFYTCYMASVSVPAKRKAKKKKKESIFPKDSFRKPVNSYR